MDCLAGSSSIEAMSKVGSRWTVFKPGGGERLEVLGAVAVVGEREVGATVLPPARSVSLTEKSRTCSS